MSNRPTKTQRLSDLSKLEIEEATQASGQPAYRSGQVWQWMSQKGIFDVSEMRNVPKALREFLGDQYALPPLEIAHQSIAKDGTQKVLFKLGDGKLIESVLIPAEKRTTICLSSQVGCAVGCHFCASGIDGGKRNLSSGEMFEVFMYMRNQAKANDRSITNLVIMGMGEPMFNLEQVIIALDRINSEDGPNLGARRITISTVGIAHGVKRFTASKRAYNLAFSLHAPNDQLRRKIVPLESAMTVEEIRQAALDHLKETGREVTFEYVMLKGVNDSPREARELRKLMKHTQASVNLIPYNPVPELNYQRPTDEAIDTFTGILEEGGVKVSVRRRKGADIDAACGQLALKKNRE